MIIGCVALLCASVLVVNNEEELRDVGGWIVLENGIDSDMQASVTKIMENPTEQDDSAKTVETKTARQVKGDLMMDRDLLKHMKVRPSTITLRQCASGTLWFVVVRLLV